ncbi:MAG: tetratricopeptide repeat protein, partial [Cyanobacteria bacterium P01_A01_bin.37]
CEYLGYPKGKAQALCQRARVYAQVGEVTEAIQLFEQALDIQECLGYLSDKAETLWHFGEVLAKQAGDVSTGLKHLHTSLTIFQQLKFTNAKKVTAVIEAIQSSIH